MIINITVSIESTGKRVIFLPDEDYIEQLRAIIKRIDDRIDRLYEDK